MADKDTEATDEQIAELRCGHADENEVYALIARIEAEVRKNTKLESGIRDAIGWLRTTEVEREDIVKLLEAAVAESGKCRK